MSTRSLGGLEIRMQVAHAEPLFRNGFMQPFGGDLGQGCNQHAIACVDGGPDLGQQVAEGAFGGAHFNDRIEQAGGSDLLIDDATFRDL